MGQQTKIKEVIVVEGKKDTAAVRQAVAADTIETRGSAVENDVIAEVKRAKQKRGVIILMDPDSAGERIRRIISREVPGCKQAFISREKAESDGRIGVEHACPASIRQALEEARCEGEEPAVPEIPWEAYLEAGMAGGAGSRRRREALANELGIGYANGQQLYRRLALLRITRNEFEEALHRIEREEPHG
ncbi:ribonuclease M5 [Paludifilum halophilum]|uniref:Ribonuclease M5 n=1 Tax=Paludifilum halophilum TaxID=1642702 RepID=A0A235B2D2_9BACL|nr:ribonuclease M5 [Paludifilum halophilum]OYD06401.1 ribonuclease M5 [Paludifilum halophilum]